MPALATALRAFIEGAADALIPPLLFVAFVALGMLITDLIVALWRRVWRRK